MAESTPYDEARSRYSRQALARLVLSDRAAGLSETAGSLAVTRYDEFCGPGGRVSEAEVLLRIAERLLVVTVIYERERGTSWSDIAGHLGLTADAAEQRYSPEVDRWHAAFDTPYRLDETGRKRVPQLPNAAYDPERACRQLDLWANVKLSFEDKNAVSAGLDGPADACRPEFSGRIWRRHLEAFFNALFEYVHAAPDLPAVERGLATTDEDEPDSWYTCTLAGVAETLEVQLANAAGGQAVYVVVTGAESAVLRLRIDTLLTAFAHRL
ncbi:hypothetical protein [Longispora albida]|uniref:hypothetical protein n=1 Tax=Longispora albida TaxID=203523 RepID=UPI0003658A3F|nr:hypothetical protein [Longispora albida]